MARAALRLAKNAPGALYVDGSCIDCETCRRVAPLTFSRDPRAGQSIVSRQPQSGAELERALMALVACPTASIGSDEKQEVAAASRRFPDEIAEGIYDCGYAAESSYGAASYLIRRPAGNVLVDSPRAAKPLIARLEELGGVELLFLTHRDDVADHARWRDQFGCRRVLHEADVSADTASVELQLKGTAAVSLADDLKVIPVPGHTRGSAVLLFGETLFTGDHLWGDEDTGELSAGRSVCWYSWPKQIRSMERLLEVRFARVLPGHGRSYSANTPEEMGEALRRLIARMKRN